MDILVADDDHEKEEREISLSVRAEKRKNAKKGIENQKRERILHGDEPAHERKQPDQKRKEEAFDESLNPSNE